MIVVMRRIGCGVVGRDWWTGFEFQVTKELRGYGTSTAIVPVLFPVYKSGGFVE